MGREAALWDVLAEHVKPFGDFVRVENRVGKGTPDVVYCLSGRKARGWLELKDLNAWPRRAGTPVKIDHFTRDQHVWHVRHMRSGGIVFVVLRVFRPQSRYYVYEPIEAWELLQRGAGSDDWRRASLIPEQPGFPTLPFLRLLLEAEDRREERRTLIKSTR